MHPTAKIYSLIVSSLVSGLVVGLTALYGGASVRMAALAGLIAGLKDVQSLLTTLPGRQQGGQDANR